MAGPAASPFGRHGIRQRVVLVVLIASVALAFALGWMFATIVRDARAQLAAERQRLATSVAFNVEQLLDRELENLASLALQSATMADATTAERQLHDAFRASRILSSVFLVRFDVETVVLAEPTARVTTGAVVALARRAVESARPLLVAAPARDGAVLVVPMRGAGSTATGAAGGFIPADDKLVAQLLGAVRPAGGRIVLRDATGTTVATAGAELSERPAIVASAPISDLGWTITVEQPDDDGLSALLRVRRIAAIVTPIVLAVAVLLAWGAGRSVVMPIDRLTAAAEAIASGNLERPVPRGGPDEAGRLARALEDMRAALRQRERDRIRGELLKRTIAVQEDERKRVARELHDETSQTVNALLMGLESAINRYPSEFTRARLEDVLALARRLLEGVHRIILALRPSMLDDLGLWSAVEWFARQQLEPLGVSVRFEVDGPEQRLPREVEIALFRVAQETITNIARHAHAEQVLIQCSVEPDRFTIEIEDDGEGFAVGDVQADGSSMRGLGLAGMRERVALVGGRIEIDSAPGSGTRVAIEVPIGPGSKADG